MIEFLSQCSQPVSAQANCDVFGTDINTFHQQLDDARLLGREELIPEWVKVMYR
jgi:hypothetical protein